MNKRQSNAISRVINEINAKLAQLKNDSFDPCADPADTVKIGPIKAVRLG